MTTSSQTQVLLMVYCSLSPEDQQRMLAKAKLLLAEQEAVKCK